MFEVVGGFEFDGEMPVGAAVFSVRGGAQADAFLFGYGLADADMVGAERGAGAGRDCN